MLINGYTDTSLSDAASITLSQTRVRAVADVLAANGVARSDMILKGMGQQDQPIVVGGAYAPGCSNRVTLQV